MTTELHDSYFRLMTIKHSVSKIEWASNDYITQLSSTSQLSSGPSSSQLETRCGRESHIRPKGLGSLMSWGPEKMLIRCSKGSHHLAEWALGLRLSSPEERERHNADGHKFAGQNIAVMFDLQLPLTVKLHTTFSNPCNKVRGKYFVKEVFLRLYHCVCYHCVGMYPAYICIFRHESADGNITLADS